MRKRLVKEALVFPKLRVHRLPPGLQFIPPLPQFGIAPGIQQQLHQLTLRLGCIRIVAQQEVVHPALQVVQLLVFLVCNGTGRDDGNPSAARRLLPQQNNSQNADHACRQQPAAQRRLLHRKAHSPADQQQCPQHAHRNDCTGRTCG